MLLSQAFDFYYLALTKRDKLLSKSIPDKNERIDMIKSAYLVSYFICPTAYINIDLTYVIYSAFSLINFPSFSSRRSQASSLHHNSSKKHTSSIGRNVCHLFGQPDWHYIIPVRSHVCLQQMRSPTQDARPELSNMQSSYPRCNQSLQNSVMLWQSC